MSRPLLGILLSLGLATPLYCLANSELTGAQIEIARPIMEKFKYDSAGSDYGVYDGYRSIEIEMKKTHGALIAIGKAFQDPDVVNSEGFKEFLTKNKTKLLYWVNYYTAAADQGDGTLFRQLLQISGGKESDMSRIYESMVSFYGAEEMAKASEALSTQAKHAQGHHYTDTNYFGETAVRVTSPSHYMIRQFRLRATEANPLNYSVFWDDHQKLTGNSPYMNLLIDLHKAGRLDIAKVFSSSLMYFNFYNLSVLSGYTSEYNVAEKTDHPWMKRVLELVGEDKFFEILKTQMMADGYYGDRENKDLLEKHFISNKVRSLEDGLFRWVTNHGSESLKAKYYDWVLEMTAKGKDWLKFADDHSGRRDYRDTYRTDDLAKIMRKALRQHVANSIAQSNGTYRTAWDFLVGKKLVDQKDADELRKWTNTATAIANKHAAKSAELNNSKLLKAMSLIGLSEKAYYRKEIALTTSGNDSQKQLIAARPTESLENIYVLNKLFDGTFIPVSEEEMAKSDALFAFSKVRGGQKNLLGMIFASQEIPSSGVQAQCSEFYR